MLNITVELKYESEATVLVIYVCHQLNIKAINGIERLSTGI